MSKKQIFSMIISSIVSVFVCLLSINYFRIQTNEIVFVENIKIFNGFLMTKELIAKGEKKLNLQKAVLDSLYKTLDNISNKNDKDDLVEKIVQQKVLIEEFQNNYTALNSNNIWKRINSYSKDFSEEKGYKIIFGYNADGNVFSGTPDSEVSDELLVYINKRYEGFN